MAIQNDADNSKPGPPSIGREDWVLLNNVAAHNINVAGRVYYLT
jgi:hypothetical protein